MNHAKKSGNGWLGLAATVIGGASLGLLATPALGDDKPDPLNDTWEMSLGAYAVQADTNVRLDGKAGDRGTKVDWEKTFGGGTLTRFRVDAQWRFAERHKLQAMWFDSSRSNTKTIDREIEWDGETYPIGAKINGTINYDVYLLDYEYSYFRRDTYELSASIGAYYAKWDAELSGTFTDPGNSQDVKHKGDANLGAPLPVLGLRGLWVLPYDLSLDVFGQWFYLSVDQYSGSLQNYQAKLTWQPKPWLGLGVGYDWFAAHGDVDQSKFHGSLDWSFDGLMLFYSFSF